MSGFNRFQEKTLLQGTLVTEHHAQIVGLSEGHCYKAFQIIGLSFKSCGIEL